jgi:hypothetical protein
MVDRRRVSTLLSTRLFNPLVKVATNTGLAVPAIASLETTGRKSGQPRRTPLGRSLGRDTCWIVAEHGRTAPGRPTSCRTTTHERAGVRCQRRLGRRQAGDGSAAPREEGSLLAT